MKVVILAGGLGTRISEESHLKPKPMIEIGGKPILWHIMKIYSHYGFNDFIICCGYKGYLIKEYFYNYFLHNSDLKIDLHKNSFEVISNQAEKWKVHLIDTGLNSMTGERIRRIRNYIDDKFLLTYGDGVGNVDIKSLVKFHEEQKKIVTLTAVQPEGRFGSIELEESLVKEFSEKPKGDKQWVNGGFFVCEEGVFDYLDEGNEPFEETPLKSLAKNDKLNAFKHEGFWHSMDTMRDKSLLDSLWINDNADWKVWK